MILLDEPFGEALVPLMRGSSFVYKRLFFAENDSFF